MSDPVLANSPFVFLAVAKRLHPEQIAVDCMSISSEQLGIHDQRPNCKIEDIGHDCHSEMVCNKITKQDLINGDVQVSNFAYLAPIWDSPQFPINQF